MKNQHIGVVIPTITVISILIITGIQDFFSPLGYNLILGHRTNRTRRNQDHSYLRISRVDGI
jgi:DNA-binding LacI/PurR family transcriptional regulator